MARGKKITSEVRGLIRREFLNNLKHNKKRKAKEIRNEVEDILRRDEKNYGHLWPIPKDWPGLSTVQHEVAEVKEELKKQSAEEKEQEGPWDMSTLGKYPIPPEAVPLVLEISMSSEQPLTIREAKWLGCLANLLSTILVQQGEVPTMDWIRGIAEFYATTERINMLMGERVPPVMDKILWDFLTKRESMDEVRKRGFDPGNNDDRFRKDKDGQLYYGVTTKELNRLQKMQRSLDPSKPFDGFAALGLNLEVKENKDEQASEQRQQTKAKGHRQHRTTEQR